MLNEVRGQLASLGIAVSHTTRAPRPGEVDGQHYHFVSKDAFQSMVKCDEFVEHAEVFGNFYGTSKQAINVLLESGKDVVLEIDWQGARQIRTSYPEAITVFILPPTLASLEERLTGRGQDSQEVIAGRMAAAREEISHYGEYDHIVINDDFEQAVSSLAKLITSPHQSEPIPKEQLTTLLADL